MVSLRHFTSNSEDVFFSPHVSLTVLHHLYHNFAVPPLLPHYSWDDLSDLFGDPLEGSDPLGWEPLDWCEY